MALTCEYNEYRLTLRSKQALSYSELYILQITFLYTAGATTTAAKGVSFCSDRTKFFEHFHPIVTLKNELLEQSNLFSISVYSIPKF